MQTAPVLIKGNLFIMQHSAFNPYCCYSCHALIASCFDSPWCRVSISGMLFEVGFFYMAQALWGDTSSVEKAVQGSSSLPLPQLCIAALICQFKMLINATHQLHLLKEAESWRGAENPGVFLGILLCLIRLPGFFMLWDKTADISSMVSTL